MPSAKEPNMPFKLRSALRGLRLRAQAAEAGTESDAEDAPGLDGFFDDPWAKEVAGMPLRPAFNQNVADQTTDPAGAPSGADADPDDYSSDSDMGHGPLDTWFDRLHTKHYNPAAREILSRKVDVDFAVGGNQPDQPNLAGKAKPTPHAHDELLREVARLDAERILGASTDTTQGGSTCSFVSKETTQRRGTCSFNPPARSELQPSTQS